MKLLYAALNHDEFPTGTMRAFEQALGAENVRAFDYLEYQRRGVARDQINNLFLQAVRAHCPDVIHGQYQETDVIDAATLKRCGDMGIYRTCWMGDCRTAVPAYTAAMCRESDLVLISNRGQIPMYQAAGGKPVMYWQIGVDWERDFDLTGPAPALPGGPPRILFSGRHYGDHFPDGRERLAVVKAFAREFRSDFAVVGSGFPSDIPSRGESARALQKWWYSGAQLSVGVNNFNHIEQFYSERQLQAMASGTCHLCWHIPGLEREFVPDRECVMFTNPLEAVEKARALLRDDDRRRAIGQAGRKKVLAEHTWKSRVSEYLAMLKERAGIS